MVKCIKTLRCAWSSVNDCKMSYFTLLFSALSILSSFMLREVTAFTLPLPDDSDPERSTWGQFPENAQEIPRSLQIEDFTLHVAPTSARVRSPTILRLRPNVSVATNPLLLKAHLPIRFGRDSQMTPRERASKSNINLPQRFGRSCNMCARSANGPSATLPQRTQVQDYIFERVEDSEETVKNTDYTALD
ncbi:Gonadotropin inhibitory hormone peptide [Labeo rohita]|uniref:Gonadotropin inhibitory hormone peptide n=1 Tax=Labeo rohita TaxID=84645 RepID=A0ABQ8LRQ4_LABRO|nr:Gonadotropin inhibitory hormone peptide [Labeo rohita]